VARALKIAMFLFGAVLALEGTLDIVLPEQRAKMLGLADAAEHAQLPMAILGATWIASGLWVIVAAGDPRRHLDCLKFAITLPALLFAALAYSALRGCVAFGQVSIDLAFDALFVLVFLALYPRREGQIPGA